MTLRQLWQWWNDVWFAPQPVTPICLVLVDVVVHPVVRQVIVEVQGGRLILAWPHPK